MLEASELLRLPEEASLVYSVLLSEEEQQEVTPAYQAEG
jgi:hypothetical protein